tara:strand:+ start:13680 stop:15320 length:1641 start_codon:yes stop_codon:yes gene_type:complete
MTASFPRSSIRTWSSLAIFGAAFVLCGTLSGKELTGLPLLPSLTALLLVFVSRSALFGLLGGAICGGYLISGELIGLFPQLLVNQLLPIFSSPWKLSAILFTLLLGGFVALLEAGGGLQALLRRLIRSGEKKARRTQMMIVGFGFFVFFDGLANSMLIGRIMRSAADRAAISREKLAYLADTTSSAVACLAFVSTWIAFQLAMIQEGYEAVGREADVYTLFFRSIPANFYCWFALGTAAVCIWRNFNPGSMGEAVRAAHLDSSGASHTPTEDTDTNGHWLHAVLPVLVLILSIPVAAYWIGSETLWPLTPSTFADAYAEAEQYVPQILVLSSVLASLIAMIPLVGKGARTTSRVYLGGIRDLLIPVGILLSAWMLGSVITQLGAVDQLSALLDGRLRPEFLPVAIFLVGACISFSTGTSWGTMVVLMPLAIPLVWTIGGIDTDLAREQMVVSVIAAVFSGAVFGDHCSPLSDTTIVSSIASGIEPMRHVQTQMPFALIAAGAAVFLGFLPLGFGVPSWICWLVGLVAIAMIPSLFPGQKQGATCSS